MEKNSDPARAMVTRVSPAMASTWATARRENGDWAAGPRRSGLRSCSQPCSEEATATIVGAEAAPDSRLDQVPDLGAGPRSAAT